MDKPVAMVEQKETIWNTEPDLHEEPNIRVKRVITAVGRIRYSRCGVGPLSTDSLQVAGLLVVEE